MKLLTNILRILAGLVFIFSGFVKGIDPLGTAYKVSDYLFNFGAAPSDTLSLVISILLCSAEFITGIMLISGSCIKTASWFAALFMLIFTPLTLYLAIYNPVSDCGCFGDAIHLTNWQTFDKNVVLSLVVLFIFIRRKDTGRSLKRQTGIAAVTLFLLLFWTFIATNILYLPLIDFRAYKTGTDINRAMAVPPGAPTDRYNIRFVYEKNGEKKLFTINDYPASDTTWKFVDQQSVLIEKGFVPPIHDFSLSTSDGNDVTKVVLSFPGYTLFMVSGKIEKASVMNLVKGFKAAEEATKNSILFYSLTSSSKENARTISAKYPVLFCDETTIKTIIRANPGFVLIHNGVVKAMWSVLSLPSPELFSNPERLIVENQHKRTSRVIVTFAISMVLIICAFCLPYWTKES
jgi:uncharacterized membrane protein YphA (DoxX/SURF4 family)